MKTKILIYRVLQKTLRRLVDWLMTCWLWANKCEKKLEERKLWK